MKRIHPLQTNVVFDRSGVTLLEVLMSMMIMSLGVSLVVSLFPIAAIRTAQATKMTSAAILKHNTESVLQRQPGLIFDPNGDHKFLSGNVSDLREHILSPSERNYIVDPNGYFAHAAAGLTFGTDPPSASPAANQTYEIADRGFCDYFGNTGPTTAFALLPRFDGGLRASGFAAGLTLGTSAEKNRALRQLAATLTGLQDNWSTEFDGFADGTILNTDGTVAGVLLSDQANLSDLPTSITDTPGYPTSLVADPELSRMTVFSVDGQFSQSYVLTAVQGTGANAGRGCLWTEDVNLDGVAANPSEDFNQNGYFDKRDLPAEFGGAVGRVLIERRGSHDFNWLLTVRRTRNGQAFGVDVVVTYNNGVTPSDERVFPTVAGFGFLTNRFTIRIPATSGVDEAGDPVEPRLRRSGYVLDVENARWYRISDYQDVPTNETVSGSAEIQVTLETTPKEFSPTTGGHAIFMPSVVEVFPLGSMPYPDALPSL